MRDHSLLMPAMSAPLQHCHPQSCCIPVPSTKVLVRDFAHGGLERIPGRCLCGKVTTGQITHKEMRAKDGWCPCHHLVALPVVGRETANMMTLFVSHCSKRPG